MIPTLSDTLLQIKFWLLLSRSGCWSAFASRFGPEKRVRQDDSIVILLVLVLSTKAPKIAFCEHCPNEVSATKKIPFQPLQFGKFLGYA